MKSLLALTPREAVLEGTADFVVNLADLTSMTEEEARDFLDSNVLTSGMELLLQQSFARMAGEKSASGIYKLSESMGGGKTQSMIVAGILAKYPKLASVVGFSKSLPKAKPDVTASFSGRATDQKVWVSIGKQLGVDFPTDRAPSEAEWRDVLKNRNALILLDEMAFYLVHAASQGTKDEGTRAATLASIALTTLFGAVRDYKECARCVIVISDLQKDWEQGAEELAKILRSNEVLGGTLQSVSNEMSKGAQTIAPVDNQKDELYAILRKRLFKDIAVTDSEKKAIADAYVAELKKAEAIIGKPSVKIREELLVSYPFHFSTKNLISLFNDNPGFQKTRDVIRLMATIVRALWSKGKAALANQYLISFGSADLNNSAVAGRFIEIKKALQDALQTDIANNGTSHAETLDEETHGLASRCAKWIYTASLSDVRPQGLLAQELAEYLLEPGRSIIGLPDALKKLYDTCWYIEQTKSGRYLFNRHRNLNAQVNSYVNHCSVVDRDEQIEKKLIEMFEPKDKRCYQKVAVMPALDKIQLERDKNTLLILKPDTDPAEWFKGQKYKNRLAVLTADDHTGIFNVNKKAQRLWAITQVVKDLSSEDQQYKKAKETHADYQTELFIALKAVFNKLYYPLINDEGDTILTSTPLLDSYIDEKTDKRIVYRSEDASKGEFVIEATLREANKYQVFAPVTGQDKAKVYQPLRNRVEQFLFPATGRSTWQQILDGAASKGHMIWVEPGTLDRMREALITAGVWREDAGQIQKPPFEEVTKVVVEYHRDKETGVITTTDIKIAFADSLMVREDAGEWKAHPLDKPIVSDAMSIELRAVDTTGKNKEGKPYRIDNKIDIHHELMTSPTPGHQVVKVKVVPPKAKLLYTIDGANPANLGKPYEKPGIDAPEGSTVRLFAEKGPVHLEISVPVPKADPGGDGGPKIDPDLPTIVTGKGFTGLVTRSATYKLLTGLPETARLQMVQAKVTVAATDSTITLTWDRKSRLEPIRVLEAFEFLDKQVPDGEWSLRFDQLHFPTGKALLEWQVAADIKIELGQITQCML